MKRLILTREQKNINIEIPVEFIDIQMPQASGDALKVYLYLCRAAQDPSIALSVTDMADLFDVTPKRIMQSLAYWEECGLLALSYSGGELSGIRLISDTSSSPDPGEEVPAPESAGEDLLPAGGASAGYPDTVSDHKADVLDPSVLDRDAEFSELLGLSEYYLKHPLNSSQRRSLGLCYLMFGRRSDVVEYLLEYCIEHGRTSFHYIEGVARGWKEDGYETLADINAGTALRSKNVYSVMNAFGLGNRAPVREEAEYIEKWTAEFDLPVILKACDRTMARIHAPSFRYADTILSSWKESGVRTVQDIDAADLKHQAQKPAETVRSQRPAKQIVNFEQRDTDYDRIVSGYQNN